jgi:O-antigen ligase
MTGSLVGPIITLVMLALTLAWAMLLKAGVYPSDWVTAILFVGLISLVYWMFARRRELAPRPMLWLRCVIWALPCYCAFQLLPLPLGLLGVLSPARAHLVAALASAVPGISKAPISVNPPMALFWSFSILSYIAVFFLVRELSWRFQERPWTAVVPLVVIASLEAVIGMLQVSAGWPNAEGSGTYTNRDHFSGMLEMVLPLAVIGGWAILRRSREGFERSIFPIIGVCLVWAVAALLLTAITYSMSRMGFFDALFSLFVIGALSLGPRLPSQNVRMASLTLVAVGMLALFIFLPPDQLIGRFAEMSATGKVSGDTRVFFWKETTSLISEFPLFGCGLGGFESTFLKYQGVANANRVEMAHNDYLQYLAELGWFGFSILIAGIVGILIPVVKGLAKLKDENRRLLLVACLGSFVAIALHSLVDFNLYIPANTMVLAWIAGVASGNAVEYEPT